MTFFFLNVMVHENFSHFQLIWFFTTMTFFFEKCHFFFKNVMVGTIFRNIKFQSKISWLKKKIMKKNFIERIIFSKFGQKRHGWGKISQIITYFSFLPTMTFFFLNVMVDENLSDFQLISFFSTMTFFFENVIFFSKMSGLIKFSGTFMVEKIS